jgi:hypothetical protein
MCISKSKEIAMLTSRFALTATTIAVTALLGACTTTRTVSYGTPATTSTTVAVPAVTVPAAPVTTIVVPAQ